MEAIYLNPAFFYSFFSRPSLLDDGGFFDRKEDSFFDRKEDSIFDRKGSLFDNERSIIANNSGTKIIYLAIVIVFEDRRPNIEQMSYVWFPW